MKLQLTVEIECDDDGKHCWDCVMLDGKWCHVFRDYVHPAGVNCYERLPECLERAKGAAAARWAKRDEKK